MPREDLNAPDLYLPLMSFISYVLLFGLVKGMAAPEIGASGFTPEILIQAIWRCFIFGVGESLIIKCGLSIMSVSLPFLDLFAYTGMTIYIGAT